MAGLTEQLAEGTWRAESRLGLSGSVAAGYRGQAGRLRLPSQDANSNWLGHGPGEKVVLREGQGVRIKERVLVYGVLAGV